MRRVRGQVLACVLSLLFAMLSGCEASSEVGSEKILEITPDYVTNQQADRELEISLTKGTFREDVGIEDIVLSQELAGLSVTKAVREDDTTLRIVLSGQASGLLADPAIGSLTISYEAIESDAALVRNAVGELTVGTPYIVNVSEAWTRLQEGGVVWEYTFLVRGGSWTESVSLNDISLEGGFGRAESVEMQREEEYLRLRFYGLTEGSGSIAFLSTASSVGEKTSFEFHIEGT